MASAKESDEELGQYVRALLLAVPGQEVAFRLEPGLGFEVRVGRDRQRTTDEHLNMAASEALRKTGARHA